jgi:hypothetical protein
MRGPVIIGLTVALLALCAFPAAALADGYTVSTDGTINLTDYASGDVITIGTGTTVTVDGGGHTYSDIQIVCEGGVSLTLKNVVINDSTNMGVCPVVFSGSGNTLTLSGANELTGGDSQPGVRVESDTSLAIRGSGTLTAMGGSNASGIGGASGNGGGGISISDGTIYAAGSGGQDIGAGAGGMGGSLAISGEAAVLLKNDSGAAVSTGTHTHENVSGTAGDKAYGIKLIWTGGAGAYLRLATVTFEGNDGSGPTASLTQHIGTDMEPPGTIIKTGYTVSKWNTAADGSGTDYGADGFGTPDVNLTLYARWVVNTYTVKYDANGGSGSMVDSTLTYGVEVKLSRNNFKQDKYQFAGWATSADGEVVYKDGESVTSLTDKNGATVTLYAVWQEKTFTVTFYRSNGTTQIGKTQTVDYGGKAKAYSAPTHTLTVFVGWKLMGDNPKEKPSLSKVTQNIRAVAQYVRLPFTVTFVDDSGHTIDTEYAYYGGSVDAPNAPEKEGYTFTGWDTSFGYIKKSIMVKAKYEQNIYTVKFKDDDGAILSTQTVAWNEAAAAPGDPEKEGYTFTGWDKAFDKVTGNLTVIAQYQQDAGQQGDKPAWQQSDRGEGTQTSVFPWWWFAVGAAVLAGAAAVVVIAIRKKKRETR